MPKNQSKELEEKEASVPLQGKALEGKVKKEESNANSALQIKTYKRRWLELLLFIFYSSLCACQWIQYSIITNIVCRYYGVSAIAVDWTSMCFMGYYVILAFPVVSLVDRFGLRTVALIASGAVCLGSWIKVFSVSPDKFYITFIGQSVVAFAQVFILILPGRLSAQWFSTRQISTATSLGIFGCQLGIALSFLLTPMIVKNHEKIEDIGNDLSFLFWCVAILTTAAFALVVLLFKDEPKLPPSEARALQKLGQLKQQQEKLIEPLKRLSKNKCYILLCNSYGLNIGVLNSFATLLNQIYLMHFENGEEDAGRIGLAMIITGMLGSITFGVILDKTHKFKETTVTVYFLSLCGQILFAVFTYCEFKWMVYVSATFLGFFMSGYLALGYEICAEFTYPESEDVTAGILNVTNNLYGMIFVVICGPVLEKYGDMPVHIGLCVVLFIGFVLTVLTKDEQRRQNARRAAQYKYVDTADKTCPNLVQMA